MPEKEAPRSSGLSTRMALALGGGAVLLVGALALFGLLYLGPFLHTRATVRAVAGGRRAPLTSARRPRAGWRSPHATLMDAVEKLGGPTAAARRLGLLLRAPGWTLGEKDEEGRSETRHATVRILGAAAGAGRRRGSEPPAGSGEAVSVLRKVMRSDRDATVREAAVMMLAAIPEPDPADMERALADESESVRRAAVPRAMRLGLFEALRRAAGDPSAPVRRAVADSLAWHGVHDSPEAREILHSLVEDGEPEVREAAGLALAGRRDLRALPLLIEALGRGGNWHAERALENWFHQRFREGGIVTDPAVAAAWEKWWKENGPHIDRHYTLTVREGDTLSEIAIMIYGAPGRWTEIQEANGGIEPTALPVGMKLVIPVGPAKNEE